MAGAARGFAVAAAASPPEGAAAPAVSRALPAVASAGIGLLALQAAGAVTGPGRPTAAAAAATARRRDERAQQRAESLLGELAALQRDMLLGRADPGRLEKLAALEVGEDGADPALREVVQAIALRAAVELARRGAPPGGPATPADRGDPRGA